METQEKKKKPPDADDLYEDVTHSLSGLGEYRSEHYMIYVRNKADHFSADLTARQMQRRKVGVVGRVVDNAAFQQYRREHWVGGVEPGTLVYLTEVYSDGTCEPWDTRFGYHHVPVKALEFDFDSIHHAGLREMLQALQAGTYTVPPPTPEEEVQEQVRLRLLREEVAIHQQVQQEAHQELARRLAVRRQQIEAEVRASQDRSNRSGAVAIFWQDLTS